MPKPRPPLVRIHSTITGFDWVTTSASWQHWSRINRRMHEYREVGAAPQPARPVASHPPVRRPRLIPRFAQ